MPRAGSRHETKCGVGRGIGRNAPNETRRDTAGETRCEAGCDAPDEAGRDTAGETGRGIGRERCCVSEIALSVQ